MNSFSALQQKISEFIASVPPRIRFFAIAVVVVGGLGYLSFQAAQKSDYATLFSGLALDDAGRIVEELKKAKIPYQVAAGGTVIQVPEDKVHETRLSVAAVGLPRGGGVGFEIFDDQKFGVSEFAQQINYSRALQGELERTIGQIEVVKSSRVHIALPKRQLFAKEAEEASASITVALQPGRSLNTSQVQAIVHLTSSSVPGLHPKRVTVVDTQGNLLWGGDEGVAGSGSMFQREDRLEHSLEHRVSDILDRALGPGRAVVKITADLALATTEQMEEHYDPDTAAVRSEVQSEEEENASGTTAGGVAGVQGNLAVATPAPGTKGEKTHRTQTTRNYELSKTVKRQSVPAGDLKRMSVAVVVDEAALSGVGAAGAAGRSAIRLEDLEQIVKQAVGFTAARGDVVAIRAMPFAPEAPTGPEVKPNPVLEVAKKYAQWGGVAIVAAVAFAMILMLRRHDGQNVMVLNQTVRELQHTAAMEPSLPPPPQLPEPQALEMENSTRSLAARATQDDSHRAAQVIRAWIAEG